MSGVVNEVLLALLIKRVEDKLAEIPSPENLVGMRGPPGRAGRDFIFAEHEETIKKWVSDSALKFEDLTEEQIRFLKGKDGRDGTDGRDGNDGKDFIPEEHREMFENLARQCALKFEELTAEQIEALRGPKGRDGKSFVFEDHKEYFDSLKPKFSDFTKEDIEALKLRFQDLTDEDKESLKLKFEHLSEEEKNNLRGPRGQRGRQGIPGESIVGDRGLKGDKGEKGDSIRGLPGPRGLSGINGKDGRDGEDGLDAPYVTDIRVDQTRDEFELVFEFSDGSQISAGPVKLPKGGIYIAGDGLGSSESSSGGGGTSLVEEGSWLVPNIVSSSIGISSGLYLRHFLKSNSGAITGTMPSGVSLQRVELVGTSDTDTLELTGSNLLLSGPMVLKQGSRITLDWITGLDKWLEDHRNEII